MHSILYIGHHGNHHHPKNSVISVGRIATENHDTPGGIKYISVQLF